MKEVNRPNVLIVSLLILATMVPCGGQGQPPVQPGVPLPDVAVLNISLSPSSFREGDEVRIVAQVGSNETMPVGNITVHFLVDQLEIGNVTSVNLEPGGGREVSTNWTAVKWDHLVTATLDVGGMPVLAGSLTRVFSVEAEPIGNVLTLVYALAFVIIVLLLVAIAPSVKARLFR